MDYQCSLGDIDLLQQQILDLRPLDNHALQQLKEYYRIGLTYSSNALEGNSLTESETKVVLEDGLTVGGKPLRDHYEASGHSDAFDLLYNLTEKPEISETDILDLHRLFYYRIDSALAGTYRTQAVIITGTDYVPPPPKAVPAAMQDFINRLPQLEQLHPVIRASRLHADLVNIHPFVDGNGRTARLLMNLALVKAGYPVTIIPPIVRADYIAALKATNAGDYSLFDNFISCMVWEAQREYLRLFKALDSQ